jgi:hypothetical protein
MEPTLAATKPPTQAVSPVPQIDELASCTSAELSTLFARASLAPSDFAAIEGHPRGRVLAVPGLDRGLVGALVRGFQGSVLYPWEGKSFFASNAHEGRGVNRFRYPLRRGWFSFRTELTESRTDGKPCIAIDYDVRENPRLARGIYDELRALGGGLYLGRGGMRLRNRAEPALVLWFLVDTRHHDLPLR